MNYDERIDVWCVGVLYFILLTNRMMFTEQDYNNNYQKDEWVLQIDRNAYENCMHVSVEGLKFIDDLVRFKFSERPFAQNLSTHRYFSMDLNDYPKMKDIVHNFDLSEYSCCTSNMIKFDTKKRSF